MKKYNMKKITDTLNDWIKEAGIYEDIYNQKKLFTFSVSNDRSKNTQIDIVTPLAGLLIGPKGALSSKYILKFREICDNNYVKMSIRNPDIFFMLGKETSSSIVVYFNEDNVENDDTDNI